MKKGINLKEMDLSRYGKNTQSSAVENNDLKKKVDITEEKVDVCTEKSNSVTGIRAVKDIVIKKKLISYPKHYEDAISTHIDNTSTATKKQTVQDFILEAIEEKLVLLGY